MIELDQTLHIIETTKTIEGTKVPREDEMGTCMADRRFTRLPVTHLTE
jgi:hypothetical protein